MTLSQYQIKPSGYASSHPRFSLFTMPPTGHEILKHPNVEPLIRVRVSNPNLDRPPGQGNIYSATTSGVALCVADWMEYLGFVRGSGYYQNKNTAGCIFLQHFGLSESNISLCHHTGDKLVSSNYSTDHLYCATGIALNRAWATEFAFYLNAQITGRSLCDPYSMDMDFENGPNIAYPIVTDGINASGNWSGQQNDSRYSTLTIFERYLPSLAVYTGITLSGAYTQYRNEGNPAPNATGFWFQSSNYQFSNWYQSIIYRVNSYALYKSLIEPMRTYWPSIEFSNYEDGIALTTGNGFPDDRNTWLKASITGRHDTRYTFNSPHFYAPDMGANYFATGVIYGSTQSDVYRNHCINRIRACSTGNNNLPIKGFLPCSGQYTFYSGTTGNTYVHKYEDLLVIMQSGYSIAGIQDWQIFYDNSIQTSADATEMLNLINNYISWYRGQESLKVNHVAPITRGGSFAGYAP